MTPLAMLLALCALWVAFMVWCATSGRAQGSPFLVGMVTMLLVAVTCLLVGGCVGRQVAEAEHAEAVDEAFQRLRGDDPVPGIDESSLTFTPSDAAPQGLPSGTVAYEAYDSATGMRFWVFRWPYDGGYGILPRLVPSDGGMVPYAPQGVTTDG